ncbi:hypothetical protein [Hyphomonas sp.]|uniref:hypothetical protein n=1 Tax=Hyphomonas sp. TaxID=87 RepID=UPI0025C64CB7|nr:hypothetical protein [Hyphomonas sp.]
MVAAFLVVLVVVVVIVMIVVVGVLIVSGIVRICPGVSGFVHFLTMCVPILSRLGRGLRPAGSQGQRKGQAQR